MNDFENHLRRVLGRREPPRDLSRAVMARIAQPSRPAWLTLWRPVLAAAAVLLILVTGFDRYREYRRGQEAKRQVMLALEITAKKIAVVQKKIGQLSQRSIVYDR